MNLGLTFGWRFTKKQHTVSHSSISNWNPNWESNGSTIVSLNLSNINRPNSCILFEANFFFLLLHYLFLVDCVHLISFQNFQTVAGLSHLLIHLHIWKVQHNNASEEKYLSCHFGKTNSGESDKCLEPNKSGAASRNPRADRTLINKSTSCDGKNAVQRMVVWQSLVRLILTLFFWKSTKKILWHLHFSLRFPLSIMAAGKNHLQSQQLFVEMLKENACCQRME